MKTPRILFALLLTSAIGCSRSRENLSPAERGLVPVYAELMVLREQYQAPASSLDSMMYRHKTDSLLGTIGMSQSEFSATITELALSQKMYQEFQTAVRLYLDSTRTKPHL